MAEAHVYVDDAITGAEFPKRPGYIRLLNSLKPRPPFQALIVMDQSRFGRDLDEVPLALKRIIGDAGVCACSATSGARSSARARRTSS